jgi:iron-sulfur cluster repair protein YtfE (RIC family)
MANQAVNHLRRDHQKARQFLTELESLFSSLGSDGAWTSEYAQTFKKVRKYVEEDLVALVRKEDELLYPLLEGLFSFDLGPLDALRGEHRTVCANLQRMCEISETLSSGENPPEKLRELELYGRKGIEALQNHLYKEERVLLPMAARFLTPEQDAELVGKMEDRSKRGAGFGEPGEWTPSP